MADVNLTNVLSGAKATWGMSPLLATIVPPSRVYAFGVPETTELPYVVIEPGDIGAYFGGTTYYSGTAYEKKNSISFTVFALYGTLDWNTLAETMSNVFGWTAANPAADWVIPNATSIISAVPEIDGFERTGERIEGLEVLKYMAKFTLTIQANRG